MPLLEVVLAGDGAQVQDLKVLGQRHADAVDIWELIACGVHAHVVRVPLEHPGRCVDRVHCLPRREHGQLRIEPPVPAIPDIADPAVEAGSLGFLLHLLLGGVLREELLDVVGGHVAAHAATAHGLRGLAAADGGASGQDVDEEEIGILELEDHGGIVHLADGARLAAGHEVRVRRGHEILVEVNLFVPEDEVVGREGHPIRPLHAFAERDGDGLAIVALLPLLGHTGHDLGARVVPEENLVRGDDAVAVLAVPGPGEAAAPRAAVAADRVQRLDDHGFLGHALLDGWQLARLDQVGEHGRLGELLRPLGVIEDELGALELSYELGTQLGLWGLGPLRDGVRCRQRAGQGCPARGDRGIAEELTSGPTLWPLCHVLSSR